MISVGRHVALGARALADGQPLYAVGVGAIAPRIWGISAWLCPVDSRVVGYRPPRRLPEAYDSRGCNHMIPPWLQPVTRIICGSTRRCSGSLSSFGDQWKIHVGRARRKRVGSLMRGQMWLEWLLLALLSSMSSAGVVEYNSLKT